MGQGELSLGKRRLKAVKNELLLLSKVRPAVVDAVGKLGQDVPQRRVVFDGLAVSSELIVLVPTPRDICQVQSFLFGLLAVGVYRGVGCCELDL